MKLLLDQNISRRILPGLSACYPDSQQVALLGMAAAEDKAIWDYARREGYAIVTHDADFHEYSMLEAGPPLVIWLRCGNQPKSVILEKLLAHQRSIESAVEGEGIWCVEIY